MNPLLLAGLFDIGGKLIDRILPDKTAADNAKLELIRTASAQEFQLSLKQIEANMVEAQNPNVFVSGWRPAVGWICVLGLGWNFVGYPMASWAVAIWKPGLTVPPLLSDHLMELVLTLLGVGTIRMVEKLKGVATK